MARQRINPEGAPDRVFQPVATPVNLYYQPNLSQVDLSRTAQIIDAFKQFSPQLERFTSDIVAVGIQKERELGALEATSGSLDAANAKAAQAIEKAGGLTPWRYEAFLDTLGRRAVREKYQAWLYQNADDLSALANPDGTLRGPEYAQQKMAEAYQQQVASQFGAGSFFAARAAADEKFKIDSQFMPSLQARHAELLKEQNLKDAKDEMFGILSSYSTMHLVDDGREESYVKERLKGVMEQYRRITGTSGAKPFTDALLEQANSQAAGGDFEGALITLRAFEAEDGKFRVMGTELGATFNAQIKQSIDSLEEQRDQSKLRSLQISELMYRESVRKAMNLVDGELAKMAQGSPTGSVVMTPAQERIMAEALVDSLEPGTVPDDRRDSMKAELATQIGVKVAGLNAPGQDVQSVTDTIRRATEMGDYVLADQLLDQAGADRTISPGTAKEMRNEIKSEAARKEILPGYDVLSRFSISEFGLPADIGSITVSEQPQTMSMLSQAQADLKLKINAGWKEIAQLPEEERAKAAAELITKSKQEVLNQYKTSHKDLIERADMRRSKDTVLTSKPIEGQIQASTEYIASALSTETAQPGPRLEVEQWINDRVRTEMGVELDRLLAEGMPPDKAKMEIEKNSRMITKKVLEEAQNFSNPNVPISVRMQAASVSQLDMGMREPTEAEAQAGAQAGLSGVVQELDQLRAAVPDVPFGLGWTQDNLIPDIAAVTKQVDLAKKRAQAKDPAAKEQLETAKGAVNDATKRAVDRMFQLQTWKSPGSRQAVPAYTVRNGAVYAWDRASQQYQFNQEMSDNYLKLRGVTGYSADEIQAGSSKEGIRIDLARMDPARDLLVQTGDDMFKLVQEYEASGGKSGTIVNWIQAKISSGQTPPSPEEILDSQHRLLRQRIPSRQP